jgi:hypothetical protein
MLASRLLPLLVALGACGGYLALELYYLEGELGFPLDDSFIHLQFARHLGAGEGLAYNAGERVAGSTAPLWTALLSLAFLLPGSPLAWAKLLGAMAHLATVDATWRLGRELGLGSPLSGLAAAFVAGTSWLVWGALSGMEIPLFTALSLWGMALHVRERRTPERPPLSLGILALAVLARPEGALLLALAVADRLLVLGRAGGELVVVSPRWRELSAGIGLASLAVTPVLLFYTYLGGSPLPTTYATKAGYTVPGAPRIAFLGTVVELFLQAQPAVTLLAAGGAVLLVGRLGGPRDRGLLPLLWVIALPLAYGVLSARQASPLLGNFGRYLFPLFPVVVLLGVLALELAGREVPRRLRCRSLRVAWAFWLVGLLALPTLAALVNGSGRYLQSVLNVEDGNGAMARWLAPRLPPEATLAVNDIGVFKYRLPNRVLDLAGIVTPEIHQHAQRSIEETGSPHRGFREILEIHRPDYMVVFPHWFSRVVGFAEVTPVVALRIPDNITLGEDEIVLYATPWTRHALRQVDGDPLAAGSAATSDAPGSEALE